MIQEVRCKNCGANLNPGADGRTLACEYCGHKVQVAIDAEQVAAGLKLDLANVDAFLTNLVGTLQAALGDRTRVQHDAGQIVVFEVNLDPELFIARRDRTGIVAQHKKLVRGVALKTATHPLDRWVQMLSKALAAHANENARLAEALTRGGN